MNQLMMLAELSGPETAFWAVVAGAALAIGTWLVRGRKSPKTTIDNKPDQPLPVDVVKRSADSGSEELGKIARNVLAVMGHSPHPVTITVARPRESHEFVHFGGSAYGRDSQTDAHPWMLAVSELKVAGYIKYEYTVDDGRQANDEYRVTDLGRVRGSRLPRPEILPVQDF